MFLFYSSCCVILLFFRCVFQNFCSLVDRFFDLYGYFLNYLLNVFVCFWIAFGGLMMLFGGDLKAEKGCDKE